jgi:hypothetical protein
MLCSVEGRMDDRGDTQHSIRVLAARRSLGFKVRMTQLSATAGDRRLGKS